MDALFLATNAPGRSAFNRVERRMAPLSRDLAGLILPHDHFGTHLNEKGETTDEELELKNFEHAGTALAEIWSETIIDSHPTVAKYVKPEESNESEYYVSSDNTSAEWKMKHVRDSHYFLQVVF